MEKPGLMVPSDRDEDQLRIPGAGVGAGIGLAVLSSDRLLLETIQGVVTTDHPIVICADANELAAQILAGRCGVALIDAGAVADSLPALTQRLREQFPDLVLIVAGIASDQTGLAGQIASGDVYRFLHKPVSAQRVRLFVEAAMRRHGEEHAATAGRPPLAGGQPLRRAEPPGRPRWLWPSAVIGALAVAVMWFVTRTDEPSPPPGGPARVAATEADRAVRELLERADAALERGALLAPAKESAAELYQRVLAADPDNAAARAGLERVVGAVLMAAEQAILAGQTDVATRNVEAARALQPDNVRIEFLTAQIAKERERALLARARAAAATGNLGAALAALDGASSDRATDAALTETRRALQRQQIDERLVDLLGKATARLQRGAVFEPAGDNARFYLESARTLAPRDPRVLRLDEELRGRLLSGARQAAAAGDTATTENWLRAADGRLSAEEVAAIRSQLAAAQGAARVQEVARLANLVTQRIEQGRLVEPTTDSARHWLGELQKVDAGGAAVAGARQSLQRALVAAGRAAAGRGDTGAAQLLLTEAEALGGADAGVLGAEIAALRERPRPEPSIVGAGSLRRTRYVEPAYPRAARDAEIEGWVDLEFTVRTDGSVADIRILDAQPRGTFDDAAVAALARWRFEPVRRDGELVDQRARMRMRFNVE